jgi:hypothetical protein
MAKPNYSYEKRQKEIAKKKKKEEKRLSKLAKGNAVDETQEVEIDSEEGVTDNEAPVIESTIVNTDDK